MVLLQRCGSTLFSIKNQARENSMQFIKPPLGEKRLLTLQLSLLLHCLAPEMSTGRLKYQLEILMVHARQLVMPESLVENAWYFRSSTLAKNMVYVRRAASVHIVTGPINYAFS